MKKLFTYLLVAITMIIAGCSESFDDSKIWDKLNDHESRIAKLEELCKQMNTNISSLQTIVKALQNNDYVTGVTPITKDGETVGYTITFTKSQPITIYHGKDGKDGQNGADGKDGVDGKDIGRQGEMSAIMKDLHGLSAGKFHHTHARFHVLADEPDGVLIRKGHAVPEKHFQFHAHLNAFTGFHEALPEIPVAFSGEKRMYGQ